MPLKKDNSPSPTSYKHEVSVEKTTKFDKADNHFIISKSKPNRFVDRAEALSKKIPGVGKYNTEPGLKIITKPMRKY